MKTEQANGFQSFRTRSIFGENGQVSMVLEAQCFQGIGAFEVDRLKVSALKLSHPSACSVFQNFSHFSLLRHSFLMGEGVGGGDKAVF